MFFRNRKHVVCLQSEDGFRQIDALVQNGMRVGLLDGSMPEEQLEYLRGEVMAVFRQRNTPLGLMLRLRPQDQLTALNLYQYILLDGFTCGEASCFIEMHRSETEAMWLLQTPDTLDDVDDLIQGVMTNDAKLAVDAREKQLLVMTCTENIPSDALLWPAGVQAEALSAIQDHSCWETGYELNCCDVAEPYDMDTVTGRMAALYAQGCSAKAVLLFTTDCKNLAAVSCLYPPVPIIAVAERPKGEAMLLRQTLRWGTLPTAISNVQQEPQRAEEFARYIAGLYGCKPGDRIVAAGHWIAGENSHNIYCFTL